MTDDAAARTSSRMPLSPMEETDPAFNSANVDQPMVVVNGKISRRASLNKESELNVPLKGPS